MNLYPPSPITVPLNSNNATTMMVNINDTATNTTFLHSDHDQWLHNVIYHIRMCFLPIIFIGTVTNILNFLVLSKREMRCLSTSVYLSALAVADLGVMYIELFRVWFEWMDIIKPEMYFTDVYCKVVNYSNGIVRDFSNWLIACLAMERVVMVGSPYSAKRLCTVRTAKTITLSLCAVLCVPHCVYLVYSTAQYRTHWVCWEDPHEPVGSLLFAIVEFFVGYTVIVVVFVLNLVLVFLLYKNNIPCIGIEVISCSKSNNHRVNNNRRLTRTLLFIAVLFILCETPRMIMSIICRFLERTDKRRIILNISYVLSGFNHASNFLIYILASPRFRLVLYQITPVKKLQNLKQTFWCWVSNITGSYDSDVTPRDVHQEQIMPLQEKQLQVNVNPGQDRSTNLTTHTCSLHKDNQAEMVPLQLARCINISVENVESLAGKEI